MTNANPVTKIATHAYPLKRKKNGIVYKFKKVQKSSKTAKIDLKLEIRARNFTYSNFLPSKKL